MKIKPLRLFEHPDLSNHVIHFVSRRGKPNDRVPQEIATMSGRGRLFKGILEPGEILAFPVFGSGESPVVCFTECTPSGVRTLICDGRYAAWGIAFTKDFVFGQGGGPAFYVRGDEWTDVEGAFPPRLRARCTKFWPGAELEGWKDLLADSRLQDQSEWTHEREWRVMGTGEPPAFRFKPEDVAFLVVPDWGSANPDYSNVVVDAKTGCIDDPDSVWLQAGTDSPISRVG